MEMNFPEIELENMTYVKNRFMYFITRAAEKEYITMIYRKIDNNVAEYGFCKSVDAKDIIARHGTLCSNFNGIQLSQKDNELLDHIKIATTFKFLGYDLLHLDNKCFIINWSKFMKAKVVESPLDEVKIVPPQSSQVSSSTVKEHTTNDFFYSAALQALKEKGSVEIHFLQAALGKVLCIKPPSSEFIGFTTDLILLIDQRNKLGYEVSYRYGSQQETLIVMTFPLSAAKKMIANLQI